MKWKLVVAALASFATLFVLAGPASAQDDGLTAEAVQAVMDNLWVFIAGILVFFMQAGFSLVESGLTRAKNVANIMAKNLADVSIGVIAFLAVGYALAFGTSGRGWWGTDGFFLSGSDPFEIGSSGVGNLTTVTFYFFQVVFAATAVTIASGAMAERTKFKTYLIFSLVMTAFIYPMVVHWTWGGGFIASWQIGDAVFSDFAGSTIVHSTGGWAAMMGAIFLGARIGKYDENGMPRAIPGHSIPFAILGVFILWLGWFGFNPGSELAADTFVMWTAFTTILSASAGTIVAAGTVWLRTGKPDVAMAGNGALAGLVSITAGTGTMNALGALVTGALGGAIVVMAVYFFDRRRIDDPVGAISVHGVCGVWGTLAVGLFARYDDAFLGRDNAGLFYGGGFDQLVVQFLMVLVVFAWVVGTTSILFFILKNTIGIRVSREEELEGLDTREHGSPGYGRDTAPGAAVAGSIESHGVPQGAPAG